MIGISASLSLTLMHFLWQGALIGLVAAGLRWWLRRSPPALRYGVSFAALAAMLAAALLTFITLISRTGPAAAGPLIGFSFPADGPSSTANVASSISSWQSRVALLWLAGVTICLVRLIAGWQMTKWIVRTARASVPAEVRESLLRLSRRLGIRVPISIRISERVGSPAVVGWLRPIVLIPSAALAGLPPEQLEAILAHELAHVLRHDFIVNVLQRCAESLLFFHPAVWWISGRVRAEREFCCDDQALALCPDAGIYARALIELETLRGGSTMFAIPAAGGTLKHRIWRIIGRDDPSRQRQDLAVAVALIGIVAIAFATHSTPVRAQSETAPAVLSPTPAPGKQGSPAAALPATRPDAWVIFHGGSVSTNAGAEDRRTAEAAHQSLAGGDLFWFRAGARAYVIQDPALLERVSEVFAARSSAGEELQNTLDQQGALSDQIQAFIEAQRAHLPDAIELATNQQIQDQVRQRLEQAADLNQIRRMDNIQEQVAAAKSRLDRRNLDKLNETLTAAREQLDKVNLDDLNRRFEDAAARLKAVQDQFDDGRSTIRNVLEQQSDALQSLLDRARSVADFAADVSGEMDQAIRDSIRDAIQKGLAKPFPQR